MSIATPPSTTLSTPSPTERDWKPEEEQNNMLGRNRASKPIYLIVATSILPPLGIGVRGSLPWGPIRSDMSFFVKATMNITSKESLDGNHTSLNAVIMGRKTWESVPKKFRPLTGRLNVIITRSDLNVLASKVVEELKARVERSSTQPSVHVQKIQSSSDDNDDRAGGRQTTNLSSTSIYINYPKFESTSNEKSSQPKLDSKLYVQILLSNSLEASLAILNPTKSQSQSPVELSTNVAVSSIFCIGGAELYRQCLGLKNPDIQIRILQTQIRKIDGSAFECDTFFPERLDDNQKWKQADPTMVEDWIGVDLPQGKDSNAWKIDEKSGTEIKVLGWEKG